MSDAFKPIESTLWLVLTFAQKRGLLSACFVLGEYLTILRMRTPRQLNLGNLAFEPPNKFVVSQLDL